MHNATVLLFDCRPLSARISQGACIEARKKSRDYKFNNDNEGIPGLYGKCQECSGLRGKGTKVAVTAGPPRPARVAVLTIDGVYGYV